MHFAAFAARRRSRSAIVLAFTILLAGPLRAAGQAQIRLNRPDAVLSEPFSLIRGARELPGGTLLVTDWIEERIALVDFANDKVKSHGRIGAGPQEFRLPARLLPFRGDSTILIDMGNQRLAVLDASGAIIRTFRPSHEAAGSPGGADRRGRLYFTIPSWLASPPLPGDSVELAVWDPADNSARVLARVHGVSWAPPSTTPQDGPRIPIVIFARQDSWIVTASGKLAIVHGRDYSVSWLDGTRVSKGPAHAERPVPVTAADRTAYVRSFVQSSPTSGRGPGGSMGHTPTEAQSDANVAAMVRRSTFAETLPFFRPGDVHADANDNLWVGRYTQTDEPRQYDVFDHGGHRIATVTLAPGRHLIALGRAHAYVVHTDDVGLQTIERHRLDGFNR